MKISKKVKQAINNLPAGTTFKYRELGISNDEYGAAAKTIERLIVRKNQSTVYQPVFFTNPKKQYLVN